MKSIKKVIIVFLILISLCFLTLFFFNFKFQPIFINRLAMLLIDKNYLTVKTNDSINKSDIKIVMELMEGDLVIYDKGEQINKIKMVYNSDVFKVYYMNKQIGTAGIFKTNWWHTHNYLYEFYLDKSKVKFRLKVRGPNQSSLEYKNF